MAEVKRQKSEVKIRDAVFRFHFRDRSNKQKAGRFRPAFRTGKLSDLLG